MMDKEAKMRTAKSSSSCVPGSSGAQKHSSYSRKTRLSVGFIAFVLLGFMLFLTTDIALLYRNTKASTLFKTSTIVKSSVALEAPTASTATVESEAPSPRGSTVTYVVPSVAPTTMTSLAPTTSLPPPPLSLAKNYTFNYFPWSTLNRTAYVFVNGFFLYHGMTVKPGQSFQLSCAASTINGTSDMNANLPFVALYGPSLFSIDNVKESFPGTFELTFPSRMDPGAYEMHIIFYLEDKIPYAMPGSPFSVLVKQEEETLNGVSDPICNAAYATSQREGRWIRASDQDVSAGLAPRDGWIWRPWACQFQMQSTWELLCAHKPLWILVVGTSTTRGIFFEFLDTILPEIQTQNLAKAQWWKCWGVLDAMIGKFRVSYRDFRFHNRDEDLTEGYRALGVDWMHQNICPGHLKANTPFYEWANMSQVGWSAPDVIVAEAPEFLRKQSPGCIEEFEASGGLFIGLGHKPRAPSLQFASRDSDTYEKNGWPYIDVHPMARPHYNNGRNDFTAKDIHYVHAGNCYGNGTASHVCSEVLEMEVFMLLHVMRQHPGLEWLDSIQCEVEYRRSETKNLTLCMQCPKQLMKSMDTDPIKCTDHIPVGCLGGSQQLEGNNTSGQACVAPSTRILSSRSTFLSHSITSPSALPFRRLDSRGIENL